jgi:hypothetical protein
MTPHQTDPRLVEYLQRRREHNERGERERAEARRRAQEEDDLRCDLTEIWRELGIQCK